MIKFSYREATGDRMITVYDSKMGIYFYRPLFGLEKSLYDHQVADHIQQRFRRWKVTRDQLLDLIFAAQKKKEEKNSPSP